MPPKPSFSTRCRNTPSAVGDRQIFPVQTNRMRMTGLAFGMYICDPHILRKTRLQGISILALKPANLQWSDDGSLRSLDFGDIYFQPGQGLEESRYVFLEGNSLPSRFRDCAAGSFHIAELGFGSGLNFLLTADMFAKEAPAAARLVYVSVEKHPIQRAALEKVYAHFSLPQAPDLLAQYPPLIEGFHTLSFLNGRVRLVLAFGDIADVLPEVA